MFMIFRLKSKKAFHSNFKPTRVVSIYTVTFLCREHLG